MAIEENIRQILQGLPPQVALVAVSKFHPIEAIAEAHKAGQMIFGESRAQELSAKHNKIPNLNWHFIGHLQTNKVKQVVACASLIHSIDSIKLLREIEKEAQKTEKQIDVLLQIHVAQEETKFGFTPEECIELAQNGNFRNLTYTRIRGVMGMASNTDSATRIAKDFRKIRHTFDTLASQFALSQQFDIVSMGMSHDYEIAINEGSNMVRIGTAIFGDREY